MQCTDGRDPSARWDDLLRQHDERQYADGQLGNKNDVKSRYVPSRPVPFRSAPTNPAHG